MRKTDVEMCHFKKCFMINRKGSMDEFNLPYICICILGKGMDLKSNLGELQLILVPDFPIWRLPKIHIGLSLNNSSIRQNLSKALEMSKTTDQALREGLQPKDANM